MTPVGSSCSDVCLSWLSEATCVDAPGSNTLSLSHASSLEVSSCPCIAPDGHCSPAEGMRFDQPPSTISLAGRPFSDQLIAMFRHQMQQEQTQQSAQQRSATGRAADPGVRMIVVSWMVEVAEEYRLQQETLHMAVLLLDRFMANSEDVPRCVLQLLAIGCVLLASKELEVSHPTVEQLCAVTANHFQPHDLLRMERIILHLLDFGLSGPSCYTFLHLLAQVCSACVTPAVLSLAMYLCELAMLDAYTLNFSYSSKAASALLLAQISLGDPEHTHFMQAGMSACMGASGLDSLGPCMAVMLRLQQIAYQHTLAAVTTAAVAVAGSPAHMHADMMARSYASIAGSVLSEDDTMMPADTEFGGPDSPMAVSTQCAPAAGQPDDLLAPLRVKFGADCWCGVCTVSPMALLPGHA